MQSFALTAADKQLIKTFLVTFIAVVAGLPVASALMPSTRIADAETSQTTVVKKVADTLDACVTETAATTNATETVTTVTLPKTNTVHTRETIVTHVGTNQSANNGGATAQVGNAVVAVPVAVNDLVDVNVGDVSVPVLSGNTTTVSPTISPTVSILSGNSKGGLLGLGILGL